MSTARGVAVVLCYATEKDGWPKGFGFSVGACATILGIGYPLATLTSPHPLWVDCMCILSVLYCAANGEKEGIAAWDTQWSTTTFLSRALSARCGNDDAL